MEPQTYNVRHANDEDDCSIIGSCLTNFWVVLADSRNRKLKLLHSARKPGDNYVIPTCRFDCEINDVCSVGAFRVAVALDDGFQFVQARSQVEFVLERKILCGHRCNGINSRNNTIYVVDNHKLYAYNIENGEDIPGENGEPRPGENGEPRPGENGEPRPGENGDPRPGENGEPRPGENGEDIPGENGEPRPGENGEPRSGEDGEPRPGENGEPRPGENGEPRPGENGEDIPGENGEEMPVENGEPRPGEIYYAGDQSDLCKVSVSHKCNDNRIFIADRNHGSECVIVLQHQEGQPSADLLFRIEDNSLRNIRDVAFIPTANLCGHVLILVYNAAQPFLWVPLSENNGHQIRQDFPQPVTGIQHPQSLGCSQKDTIIIGGQKDNSVSKVQLTAMLVL